MNTGNHLTVDLRAISINMSQHDNVYSTLINIKQII